MLIINADDWGRSRLDTDTILSCHTQTRISSISAMVFMQDSQRAAELAKKHNMDVGLHLNFTEQFNGTVASAAILPCQNRTQRYLCASKYALLLYNPFLKSEFRFLYQAQLNEFIRLYGCLPSHIDGHQHMHLCANMVIDGIIKKGERVRRSFSFWPGEKSTLNRAYRQLIDFILSRRYRLTDTFFALSQVVQGNRRQRIVELARVSAVELMTHPRIPSEYAYLMSDDCLAMLRGVAVGNYAML